jgi:hypothetical protein
MKVLAPFVGTLNPPERQNVEDSLTQTRALVEQIELVLNTDHKRNDNVGKTNDPSVTS